jgi:arylsulfatase A-like enzyme
VSHRWAFVALLACACGGADGERDGRPDILLISVDTLRADHLGCYGYERDTSPALDGLAAEGVLFTTATSSTSWTLPAHASMFTGLPQSVHGLDRTTRVLADERATLAESLQRAGYHTLGAWSGPYLHPHFGLAQGFDDWVSCVGYDIAGEGQLHGKDRSAHRSSHEDITSPRLLAQVERWMNARDERPLFLFVHMWDVHYDFLPPAPYDSMFDPDYNGPIDGRDLSNLATALPPRDLEHLIALYDGEIRWTDHHIGAMLELVGEEAIVVVTSDHGEEFFEHGHFGHRRTLYEESIRVPLIIRAPGMAHAGRRAADLASVMDVAPTLLELAGASPLPETMGRSLVPAWTSSALDPVPLMSELYLRKAYTLALRTPGHKLILGEERELFDLQQDPGELRPLGAEAAPPLTTEAHAALLAELQRLARQHELPGAADAELPAQIDAELRKLGYIDDED